MFRFVICSILLFQMVRCSVFDAFQQVDLEGSSTVTTITESLRNFQLKLEGYYNDFSEKMTAFEKSCKETVSNLSHYNEYQVRTEGFASPLLNEMFLTAEGKMSDLAQIFEDDLDAVIDDVKKKINVKIAEKFSDLEEAIDEVRGNYQKLAIKGDLGEIQSNAFECLALKSAEQNESDDSLPTRTLLTNMSNALDDQFQILQGCNDKAKRREDILTEVRETSERISFSQVNDFPTCPTVHHLLSSLDSAAKKSNETLASLSVVLENTENNILTFLNELKSSVHQRKVTDLYIKNNIPKKTTAEIDIKVGQTPYESLNRFSTRHS